MPTTGAFTPDRLAVRERMFDPAQFLIFVAASAVLIVTPGPAVLFIIAQSISQGRLTGVVIACGVGTGNLMHVIAVALGLSAAFASSPLAFAALKYAGAAYLIYLGLRRMLTKSKPEASAVPKTESSGTAFKQGLVVGLLNPKSVLFFLAFLPQFTRPGEHPVWLQLLTLGLVFVAMGIVGDSSYGLLSGTIGQWMKKNPGFARAERFLSGAVYCALGVAAATMGLQGNG
jgi:threonine/homoserine/homoserine lactone efflux protein